MPPVTIKSAPGVVRDTTRFDNQAHTDALWCRWDRGLPSKMGGYRVITNQVAGVARGCTSFSRDGQIYVHIGHSDGLQQIRFTADGVVSSIVDRTPTGLSADPNRNWQFTTLFDPISNNDATLIAWPGRNLSQIDAAYEPPAYFGKLVDGTPLIPMSMPVFRDAHTITSITGDLTSGSTLIDNVSNTEALRYGMTITATGVPLGAYVASFTDTTITISNAATATEATASLTIQVGGACGGIVALHPYLFAYGSSGRILWARPQNPNDWWGTGSNEAFVTEQKIVRGYNVRGGAGNNPAGLFWSLNSLIRATFIGGDAVFNFDTLTDAISLLSTNSIVEYDGVFMWPGLDRFYMYAGAVREIPNAFNLNYFFDGLNTAQRQKVFGFRNPRYGEIWWCYPRGFADECTHAIVYNVRGNYWYDTQLPNGGRSGAVNTVNYSYPVLTGVEETPSGRYRLWQHEFGADAVDGTATTAVRSYFQTGDISLLTSQQPQDKALAIDRLEPDFQQTGDMTLTVLGNANARAPTVEEQSMTFTDDPDTDDQIVNLKATRRQMRFRFESNVLGGNYRGGRVIAHIKESDGRQT